MKKNLKLTDCVVHFGIDNCGWDIIQAKSFAYVTAYNIVICNDDTGRR